MALDEDPEGSRSTASGRRSSAARTFLASALAESAIDPDPTGPLTKICNAPVLCNAALVRTFCTAEWPGCSWGPVHRGGMLTEKRVKLAFAYRSYFSTAVAETSHPAACSAVLC